MIHKNSFRHFLTAFSLFAGGVFIFFILTAEKAFSREVLKRSPSGLFLDENSTEDDAAKDTPEETWRKEFEKLEEILRTPITVAFQKTPLPEAVRYMNETYGLQILVSKKFLDADGKSPEITLTTENLTLRSTLHWMLRQCGRKATWHFTEKGEIFLTNSSSFNPFNPWQEDPEEEELPPADPFPEEMRETLQKPVTVAFRKTPLPEVVRFLNETYDARLQLGEMPLPEPRTHTSSWDDEDEEETSPDAAEETPIIPEITLSAKDITLRNALFWMLEPWNMAYYEDRGEILLTTREKMESRLFEKSYPLPWEDSADSLQNLFETCTNHKNWDSCGGPGYCRVTPDETHIRVIQNQYVMEECDILYRKVIEKNPIPPTVAEKRLAETLETEVSLDYENITVKEFFADITRRFPISVVLHVLACHDLEYVEETRFTIHIHGVRLRSALKYALQNIPNQYLRFTICREVLLFADGDDLYENLPMTFLPFPDLGFNLMEPEAEPETPEPEPEEGTELPELQWSSENMYPLDEVMTILSIHTDVDCMINGSDWTLVPSAFCKFIITRTDEEVQDIKNILDFLDGAPWPKSVYEEKIERALAQPVNLKYAEPGVTLAEIAADLEKACGISVLVDEAGLDMEGIDAEAKFTLDAANRPLGDALNETLRPAKLGFVILYDSLLITSRERAEESCFTRGYEIPLRENESMEEIEDALEKAVRPGTWEDDRGVYMPGRITTFGDRFFIRQTLEGHMEIEKFLETRKKENAE